MNKKEYIQPQIFFVPLQTESLLAGLSGTKGDDDTVTLIDIVLYSHFAYLVPKVTMILVILIQNTQEWESQEQTQPRSTLTTLIPGIPGIKNYQ